MVLERLKNVTNGIVYSLHSPQFKHETRIGLFGSTLVLSFRFVDEKRRCHAAQLPTVRMEILLKFRGGELGVSYCTTNKAQLYFYLTKFLTKIRKIRKTAFHIRNIIYC
jgi:hypothetical protein